VEVNVTENLRYSDATVGGVDSLHRFVRAKLAYRELAGPSTLKVDSPAPALRTMMSDGAEEGLLSRWMAPFGT
jgi:hypothetical protein